MTLEGNLTLPERSRGIVLFAHGSGSSRHSPRNQFVANVLQQSRLATLLIDLLTADEEAIDAQTMHLRFDIGLLAERLVGAAKWLHSNPETENLKIGIFGASTGAAAALVAATRLQDIIFAVVSRGGRPDLATDSLTEVEAPTLLIVGGDDLPVIDMNKEALQQMQCERELVIVPGATHLFEEPGKLEAVAHHATEWFVKHLAS